MTHRVGIIGAGMVSRWHVPAWRNAGAAVVAVADVNPEALAGFAEHFGIDRTFEDYREMFAEVDIVDVCTPPWLHAPMTIEALEAGKDVLCEKPFSLNAGEAAAMADAADRTGRLLACRQGDTRLASASRRIAEIVQSGMLGDIYFMRLIGRSLYRPGIEYNPGATWFLDRARAGGGALYDWGVYDLELLFSAYGPLDIAGVTATLFTGIEPPDASITFDVEEHAVAMLKLRNGATIYWERAWATHLPEEHRWTFYGTKAGLSFIPHSEVLRIDPDLQLTRYAHLSPVTLEAPPEPPRERNVYEDFLQAVDGEHPPACSGREAADMMAVIEAVYTAGGIHIPA